MRRMLMVLAPAAFGIAVYLCWGPGSLNDRGEVIGAVVIVTLVLAIWNRFMAGRQRETEQIAARKAIKDAEREHGPEAAQQVLEAARDRGINI